jgi:predicted kinase
MWTFSENKDWQYLTDTFDWVADMAGVPQDPRHHAEGNVDIHTQMVLAALPLADLPPQEQEVLWAAALLHDVEKRSTTVHEADGSITSAGHARKGETAARRVLYRDVPTPFHIREQIAKLVRYHGLPLWLLQRTNPIHLLIKASLQVNTRLLALLARADVMGRICNDQAHLLYQIDCFEELCRELGCWCVPYPFATSAARMHYLTHEDADPSYIPFEQPSFEVVIMSGLPGAGKDTYIRQHYKDWPVISLDAMRVKLKVDYNDSTGSGHVIQAAKEAAREHLRQQRPFVWNATNITRQMREQLISLCLTYKAHVTVVYVEAAYQTLFRQNKQREAVVPVNAMEKLVDKLEPPDLTEAHQVVYSVY